MKDHTTYLFKSNWRTIRLALLVGVMVEIDSFVVIHKFFIYKGWMALHQLNAYDVMTISWVLGIVTTALISYIKGKEASHKLKLMVTNLAMVIIIALNYVIMFLSY